MRSPFRSAFLNPNLLAFDEVQKSTEKIVFIVCILYVCTCFLDMHYTRRAPMRALFGSTVYTRFKLVFYVITWPLYLASIPSVPFR